MTDPRPAHDPEVAAKLDHLAVAYVGWPEGPSVPLLSLLSPEEAARVAYLLEGGATPEE
jgi:hypothetical protein